MKKYLPFVLLFGIIWGLYYTLNYLTPMLLDDCMYAVEGRTISDIIRTQAHDYMNINGRVLAHSIVQLFCGIIGKTTFNFFNATIVCLLVLLLVLNSNKNNRTNLLLYTIALLLVWFCLPDQYTSMFMIAGSLNYIWASVVVLSFLFLYRNSLDTAGNRTFYAIAALAFIAGVWGEMYSVCVAPALFFDLIFDKQKHTKRYIITFCAFAVGALIMIGAPGNFARFGIVHSPEGGVSTNISTNILNIILWTYKMTYGWIILGIIVFATVQYFYNKTPFFRKNAFWLLCIGFYLGFLSILGITALRTFFPLSVFGSIILLGQLGQYKIPIIGQYIISLILLVIICVDFKNEVRVGVNNKQNIEKLITLRQLHPSEDYVEMGDMQKSRKTNQWYDCDKTLWSNIVFSEYYDLQPCHIIPTEVYKYCNTFPDSVITQDPNNPFVLLDHYAVCRADSIVENVELVFSEQPVLVMRSKPERILATITKQKKKIYSSYNDIFFGKWFLEEKSINIKHSGIVEIGHYRTADNKLFVFVKKSLLESEYGLPIQRVKFKYEEVVK